MLKKSALPILLLACVLMLSVFYVKETMNSSTTPVNGGTDDTVDTKYALFAEARLDLLEERNSEINELEALVASGELTSVEVEANVNRINYLCDLKYDEIALENTIIAMGYDDVFVIASTDSVKISILAESFTNSEFVTVALAAKEKFTRYHAVSVTLTIPEA